MLRRIELIVGIGMALIFAVDFGFQTIACRHEINAYSKGTVDQNECESIESPVLGGVMSFVRWFLGFVTDNDKAIIALSTVLIAIFTASLWLATNRMWKAVKQQAIDMKASLAISKQSADTAIRSAMPVLFPWILDMARLHPLNVSNTNVVHSTLLLIGFDNFGRSPGIIRDVQANLFLTENDEIPNFQRDQLTRWDYAVMIPADSRAVHQTFGALEFRQDFTFTAIELQELLTAATDHFRRFFFVGEVVYDDFFGLRHTSRFCVKLRMWRVAEQIKTFQVAKGSEYNQITYEQIPKPDPLG